MAPSSAQKGRWLRRWRGFFTGLYFTHYSIWSVSVTPRHLRMEDGFRFITRSLAHSLKAQSKWRRFRSFWLWYIWLNVSSQALLLSSTGAYAVKIQTLLQYTVCSSAAMTKVFITTRKHCVMAFPKNLGLMTFSQALIKDVNTLLRQGMRKSGINTLLSCG